MLRASIAKELLFRASDMARTESPRSAIIFGVVLSLSCSLSQSRSLTFLFLPISPGTSIISTYDTLSIARSLPTSYFYRCRRAAVALNGRGLSRSFFGSIPRYA